MRPLLLLLHVQRPQQTNTEGTETDSKELHCCGYLGERECESCPSGKGKKQNRNSHCAGHGREEAPLQVCINTSVLDPLPHCALSHARSCAGSVLCKADSYEMFVATLRMSGLISSLHFYFNNLCRIHYTHLTESCLFPVHCFLSPQKPAILFSPQLISKRPRA